MNRSRSQVQGLAIEQALDGESPKDGLISLILACQIENDGGQEQSVEQLAETPPRALHRPHHREMVSPSSRLSGGSNTKRAPGVSRKGGILGSKHCMLSYCWGRGKETQKLVVRVRKNLMQRGLSCWMDIDGEHGSTDIYEMMAAGVENAAVVLAFMNPEYQNSENCQLELKFAKQSGLPIVPIMTNVDATWKATG